MNKKNSFLQMHSINGVGGGFAPSLDFHYDSHQTIEKTDYGKQEAAKEESVDKGSSVQTDKDGSYHIYERGTELAYSDRNSRGSSDNDYDKG